jgi:hypothetical protein
MIGLIKSEPFPSEYSEDLISDDINPGIMRANVYGQFYQEEVPENDCKSTGDGDGYEDPVGSKIVVRCLIALANERQTKVVYDIKENCPASMKHKDRFAKAWADFSVKLAAQAEKIKAVAATQVQVVVPLAQNIEGIVSKKRGRPKKNV